VSYRTATKLYLGGLFLLLASNAISGALGAIGLRGLAFYHTQALLLFACATHLAVLILRGRLRFSADPSLVKLVLVSIGYTATSCILLLRFSDVSIGYVLLMLYTFLVYPVMTTLMLGCERMERQTESQRLEKIPRWLIAASTCVLLFGWLQYFARDTFFRVTNSENVSKLVETSTLGTFRPPSIFESSFQFGLFSVLVFCLSASAALFGEGRRRAWLLALLALASVLLSQTRNVYLAAACSIFSLLLLRRARRKGKSFGLIRNLPWAYVAIAVGVMLWAVVQFLASDLQKTEDLADVSSAWARVSGWQTAWQSLVTPGSLFDVLFGYGITQAGHASDYSFLYPTRGNGLFIDSTFFNLFLFQGAIGLLLYLAIYWTVWTRLLFRVRGSWNPLAVGLACFVSAFLATGVLNIVNGQWWGVTLALSFLVLAKPTEPRQLACAA